MMQTKNWDWKKLDPLIRQALREDIGPGDWTTRACIPSHVMGEGEVIAKESGILAGLDIFFRVFIVLDPKISVTRKVQEGARIKNGMILGTVKGPVSVLLQGERTALNFLQRLCGIATFTSEYVQRTKGTKARILDTRKTTPLWRPLEKYAVRMGGGENHRLGLYDMILIKNNHIAGAGGLSQAIEKTLQYLHRKKKKIPIVVEARTLEEVTCAMQYPIRRILLDNMTPQMLRKAVRLVQGRCQLEASGNVSLKNVRTIAKTGVDYISIGALTHSAPALDISFRIEPIGKKN